VLHSVESSTHYTRNLVSLAYEVYFSHHISPCNTAVENAGEHYCLTAINLFGRFIDTQANGACCVCAVAEELSCALNIHQLCPHAAVMTK